MVEYKNIISESLEKIIDLYQVSYNIYIYIYTPRAKLKIT